MTVRNFKINQALESYAALKEHLNDLTEEEVLAALDLESATNRRQSILTRLFSRAARLNEVRYVRQLKEKYHGPRKENPDRS